MESIFRTQFHTAIIGDSHRMLLQKVDLDDAFKDKRFPENAKVELIFEAWDHADAGVWMGGSLWCLGVMDCTCVGVVVCSVPPYVNMWS